jgi:hypothetical protein
MILSSHPTSHHCNIQSSHLLSPKDSSRNYFEFLQDADVAEAIPASRQSVTFADPLISKSDCSEGVLTSTSPKETRRSEPAIQRSPLNLQFTQFTVLKTFTDFNASLCGRVACLTDRRGR